MKLALYKGRIRLLSKIICYWTQSPYSHVELVFSDGMCGSSHDLDLGVRLTKIDFEAEEGHWDFIEIDGDEDYARAWFEAHANEPYDYEGLLSFIIPIKHNPHKWTCVKAVLTALGYDDAWRFEPSMLPSMFKGPRKNDILTRTNRALERLAIHDLGSSADSLEDQNCGCDVPCQGCCERSPDPGTGPCGSANCAICSSPDF